MNRNKIIQKIIWLLFGFRSKDIPKYNKIKGMPMDKSSIFRLRNVLIVCIVTAIGVVLYNIYSTTRFMNRVAENVENASNKAELTDTGSNKEAQREQQEVIEVKKGKATQQKDVKKVKKAQDVILALKEEYLALREGYSKYIDIHGNLHQGIAMNNDIQGIITSYQSKQRELIEKLEECECLIEYRVRSHIKHAKKLQKELQDIKYKIGEYALKTQKDITEEEAEELNRLTEHIKSINKWDLVTDREKLIYAFFEGEEARIGNCPCDFMIKELWSELRKDKHFMKSIVPLRLKINIQEYRHVIDKMEIMGSTLN